MNGGKMLTIYYSGLIAFDIPATDAKVARAMLVTPGHVHLPRLLVDYETIEKHDGFSVGPKATDDILIPVEARALGSRGELLGTIDLTGKIARIDGLSGSSIERKDVGRAADPDPNIYWANTMPASTAEREDLSWIPEMSKVVKDWTLADSASTNDPNSGIAGDPIGACIDVDTGIFATDNRALDRESGTWAIDNEEKKKYEQHTSDMLTYSSPVDPKAKVVMKFWNFGDDPAADPPVASIEFKSMEINCSVTCFPASGGSETTADHFAHYFDLLKTEPATKPGNPTRTGVTFKAVYPVKCMPVIFP